MPAWIWEHQDRLLLPATIMSLALDPRSHGDSERVTEGHYPNRLARDIRELTQHLETARDRPGWMVDGSLAGLDRRRAVSGPGGSARWFWSMKCWDIRPTPGSIPRRLGKGRLELQSDRKGVTDRFVRGMYKRPQPEEYLQRIMAASLRTPTNTAVTLGASFAAVGDWRKILPGIDRPLLLVVTEPQRKQAEGVSADLPSARVVIFERAGHASVRRRARPLQPAPAGFPRPGRIGSLKPEHLFFRAFCKIPQRTGFVGWEGGQGIRGIRSTLYLNGHNEAFKNGSLLQNSSGCGRDCREGLCPRERGRPARTMPGTAPAISATGIERQRRRGIDIFYEHGCTGCTRINRTMRFLHRKPARAMIRRGLADAQDCKPAVS